jgi:hypothetical protein
MKYYLERSTSILSAILMLQTLYYKFSAAPESIYIFTELGIEPFGRIGIGIVELVASILLVFRKTSIFGAILGIGVIAGAIFAHIFIIGIEVQNDKGVLFGLAFVIFVASSLTIYVQKDKFNLLIKRLK